VNAQVPSISEICESLPPEVDPVFRTAMAKDPNQRFDTAADFVASLRAAFAEAAGSTRTFEPVAAAAPPPPPPPAAAALGRRRRPVVWIGLLALLAAGAWRAVRGPDRGPRAAAVACLAGFAVAAALPLFVAEGSPTLDNMVLTAAYVAMALGLNVVVGFAGLLDLGYVAFFAIGAYTAAYLASGFWANAGSGGRGVSLLVGDSVGQTPGIHVNFLLVLAAAGATAAIGGCVIGIPTLRLRGDYVGIVTLAFGEIIGQLVANGRSIALFGGTLTAGGSGIGPIDSIELPLVGRFDALDLRPWYWFALVLVALALTANVNLRDSRIGRAWRAMRDDETTAASAGIPIVRTKLLAYGTGAAFGGVSGSFLASYIGVVEPGQFEFSFSLYILAMVVLGGVGSVRGVVAGAVLVSVVNNYVLSDVLPDRTDLSLGFYGVTLVLVTLLRPQGLARPS
jgi:branched-chain amino acid transport system permease protein